MSEIKDGWKEAGKGLGNAFKTFGKTFVRSARTVVDKADDNCNKPEEKKEESEVVDVKEINSSETDTETSEAESEVVDSQKESTVFNDGSWREVGKGFGKGFGNMGKMIGKTLSHPFKKEKKAKKSKNDQPLEVDVKEKQ